MSDKQNGRYSHRVNTVVKETLIPYFKFLGLYTCPHFVWSNQLNCLIVMMCCTHVLTCMVKLVELFDCYDVLYTCPYLYGQNSWIIWLLWCVVHMSSLVRSNQLNCLIVMMCCTHVLTCKVKSVELFDCYDVFYTCPHLYGRISWTVWLIVMMCCTHALTCIVKSVELFDCYDVLYTCPHL